MPTQFRVPVLKMGQTYKAPRPYGCEGCGMEWVIHHAAHDDNELYIVCREFDLEQAIEYNRATRRPRSCIKGQQGDEIRFFRGRDKAVDYFDALMSMQIAAIRAHHEEANRRKWQAPPATYV